jgi:hypothetical protein
MIYIIITASIDNNYCDGIKAQNLPRNSPERDNRYITSITQLLQLIDNDPNITRYPIFTLEACDPQRYQRGQYSPLL